MCKAEYTKKVHIDTSLQDLGCVILASGMGKRFGSNKLMADFHGEPMIARILSATKALPHRIVVTRHADVAEFCKAHGVDVILHDFPNKNDSVRLGLEKMLDKKHCMFCPADQPCLRAETVNALAEAAICQPDFIWRTEFEGEPGSPVIFPAAFYEELLHLPKDMGGGYVIKKYPERVKTLHVRDKYELMDADTKEALQELLESED